MVIHAFVTSRTDYCNSLLFGLPNCELVKLQIVQNVGARLLTSTKKYDHITPILRELHWLPVRFRIHCKILLLTLRVIHGMAPHYISNLINVRQPVSYSLHSCASAVLVFPKGKMLCTFGDRTFRYGCAQTLECKFRFSYTASLL